MCKGQHCLGQQYGVRKVGKRVEEKRVPPRLGAFTGAEVPLRTVR